MSPAAAFQSVQSKFPYEIMQKANAMGDDFDPNDFDAPRRDLNAFFLSLNKAIRNDERGYQAGLRGKAAVMLASHIVVAESFGAFSELIDHKCFADDEKIRSLNESNYHKYVAKCVVKRAFAGSDAFPSTISKFTTTLKYLVVLEVEPEECAQTIKDAGGFKEFYESAVAAKRRREAASGRDEKGAALKARSRSRDKSASKGGPSKSSRSDDVDDEQDDSWDEQEDEERHQASSRRDTPPEAFARPLTVKYLLNNYLMVKMHKKALDRYRNGPFSEDERRGLEIAYHGEGPRGLQEWAFVSKLEVEDPDAPEEDNDNDADEDAA